MRHAQARPSTTHDRLLCAPILPRRAGKLRPRPASPYTGAVPERGPIRRTFLTALLVAVAAAIGLLDYFTGPQVDLSVFYLAPTVMAALWLGYPEAVVCALAGCLGWFLTLIHFAIALSPATVALNFASRLLIYVAVAVLLVRVRQNGRRLRQANQRLRELLEREERLARTDSLTGLANTRSFLERLADEIERAQRNPLVVAYLDLDQFKAVNDRYGHARGDALLREIALAIRGAIRTTDLAARLGGDEFVILFRDLPAAHVEEVARRLIGQIAALNSYPDVRLGACVGIAVWTAGTSSEELLRRADEAMYQSKDSGRGRVSVWQPAAQAELPLPAGAAAGS
jgi:diguanylate cyclase (GGDEF)-like protein